MQKKSLQEKIWESDFGKKYTKRNTFNSYQMWNRSYIKKFGVSKEYINKNFLQKLSKKIKILEIGCNIGNQLHGLQRIGFKNLSGIDIQQNCLKKIKNNFKNVNVVRTSAYNLPFKKFLILGITVHEERMDQFPNKTAFFFSVDAKKVVE